MSSAFQYKTTTPENNKDEYNSYDIMDFIITDVEGMSLVANSICLHADLQVNEPTNTRVAADSSVKVYFNARTGAHNFFESCSVLTGNQGQLESNNQYSRYVNMVECATKDTESRFNTSDVCELKCNSEELALGYNQGAITATSGTNIVQDKSFSIKPVCCLTKMSADLPFSKVGFIKLSLSCARADSALYFGGGAGSTMKYILRNVRLTYQTTPSVAGNTLMRSVMSFTQNIQSANSSIIAKVPGIADSVSCVFLEAGSESNPIKNSQQLSRIGNITEVSFHFKDSTNTFVTYPIRDMGEITERFVKSVMKTGKNSANSRNWKSNDSFGVGLDFGAYVDLSNQKFTVNINTDGGVSATNPYSMNCFFGSMISL